MKSIFVIFLALAGFFLYPADGLAQSQSQSQSQSRVPQRATAADAQDFVKKGVAFYKANGREKSLVEFSNPKGQFVKGELYFFVYGANGDGVALAHGQNPTMIGRKLLDMKDVDGVEIIREGNKIANSPSGNGWMEYRWHNSVTKALERKRAYVERVGDIWIGCGYYLGE